MEKIYVGKIANTFGIKGELKIISSFEYALKAFKIDNKIYIENSEHSISSVRFHHFNYLVRIDNINDINEVTHFIGKNVYIDREELHLSDDEYLFDDLIGLSVYSEEELIGDVLEVRKDVINPLIKVNNFYVPIKGFVKTVDLKNKKILCSDLKGLML